MSMEKVGKSLNWFFNFHLSMWNYSHLKTGCFFVCLITINISHFIPGRYWDVTVA